MSAVQKPLVGQVAHQLEAFWCDVHGVWVSGWTQVHGTKVDSGFLQSGSARSEIIEFSPRPAVIPAILRVDPCPGAVSDGIDALRVANEEVPSILAGGDDCLVAVPNTLAELIAAQIVPDVLHRVEVWRVGR